MKKRIFRIGCIFVLAIIVALSLSVKSVFAEYVPGDGNCSELKYYRQLVGADGSITWIAVYGPCTGGGGSGSTPPPPPTPNPDGTVPPDNGGGGGGAPPCDGDTVSCCGILYDCYGCPEGNCLQASCAGNYCGQSCGGFANGGAQPTYTNIVDGKIYANAQNMIEVQWTPAGVSAWLDHSQEGSPLYCVSSLTQHYIILIPTDSTQGCDDPRSFCAYVPSTSTGRDANNQPSNACGCQSGPCWTHHSFSLPAQAYAYNVSITSYSGCGNVSPPAISQFQVVAAISGSTYLDEERTAVLSGNGCTTQASLSKVAANFTFSTSESGNVYETDNTTDGDYSMGVPYWSPGNYTVSLAAAGDGMSYACACPTGCSYSGISAPTSGLNFYLVTARSPWFQAVGGPIAAYTTSGAAVSNPIPSTCEPPDCSPYLIRNATGAGTDGFVVTGGGSVDLSESAGVQTTSVAESGANIVGSVSLRASDQRFSYFYRLFKFSESPNDDFTNSAQNAAKPTGDPDNPGVEAYIRNGDLTIGQAWSVANDESLVVFVDGNLTIGSTINVAEGGFLAFIVSGDIIVDPSVGHVDLADETGVVEGVYVADGLLSLPSRGKDAGGDLKFVGEGTFVGWGGVNLARDYSDNAQRRVENNSNPTELFRYRPDLVVNAPIEMRTPHYEWREVNP